MGLSFDDLLTSNGYAARGVASVDDKARMLDDPVIVVGVVVGENQYGVGGREIVLG